MNFNNLNKICFVVLGLGSVLGIGLTPLLCKRENVVMHEQAKWEVLGTDGKTQRLAVPGGWIVRTIVRAGCGVSTSMIFVPDPSGLWLYQDKGK